MNRFRITIVILMSLLLATSESSAIDRIYCNKFNIKPGSKRMISFELDNNTSYQGFQLDLVLPEGLMVDDIVNEILMSSRTDKTFSLFFGTPSLNTYRIGVFSLENHFISGNTGTLFNIIFTASNDFNGGAIELKNILFVNSDNNDVTFDNFKMDVGTEYCIKTFIEDFSISIGETKEIHYNMDNEIPISAFQLDVVLPAGLTIDENSIKKSDRCKTDHYISYNWILDNILRIICFSPSNQAIEDTNGKILSFNVTAESNLVSKTMITFTNQFVSDMSANEYKLEDSHCILEFNAALIAEITLNYQSAELKEGESLLLVPNIIPEYASNKTLMWSSSDTSVAQVSEYGNVTAISEGSAIISCSTTDGSELSATCSITVIRNVLSGDVNGNGKVNIADVTVLQNYILGKDPKNFVKEAADVNGNGKINIADVTSIIKMILSNGN